MDPVVGALAALPAAPARAEAEMTGAAETRHVHATARQFFYVLSGTATMEFEGDCVAIEAGQGLHVPSGVPHRFLNASPNDVHFLVVSAPSTRGDRMEVAGAGAAADAKDTA